VNDEDRFAADLRRVAPARPPEEFMARLLAAKPSVELRRAAQPRRANGPAAWARAWGWLAAATAVLAAAAGLWRWHPPPGNGGRQTNSALAVPALRAHGVQIDQALVWSFDAVARLPSGEPIRFRCREWMDQVVLSDRDRGVVFEQRAPRVEVVPVRFETY
jgi:hypothetical protein